MLRLFSILLVLSPALANAQRTLSLNEALELAQKNNYDLKAQRARLDQAKTGVETAWAALLPNVSAQGKYTHNYKEVTLDFSQSGMLQSLENTLQTDTISDLYSKAGSAPSAAVINDGTAIANYLQAHPGAASGGFPTTPIVIQKQEQLNGALNATVPLIIPWAYSGVSSARRTVDAAKATYDLTETTVLFSVAQAFYAAAGADELVAARKNAILVAKKTVDNTQARLNAGVVNKVELMRAQLALVRAEQAAKEALDAEAQGYRALATLIQLKENFRVESSNARTPQETHDFDTALKLRPEYRAADLNVRASRASKNSSAWRWAPTLSAFGNLSGFNYAGFSGDRYSWLVGLQLDWQIYDGGVRDAQRHLAAAQERENQAHLLLMRDTIADDIANADRAHETKLSAVETARRSVELSKQTLDLVRVQYDAGTATQLDLLTAQDNLVAADVALAQSRFDLQLAALTVERVNGTFPQKGADR